MRSCSKSRVPDNVLLVRGTGVFIGVLCVFLVIWHGYERLKYPEYPRGAVHSRSGIAQRALRIGIALGGSARIVLQPMLQNDYDCKTARQFAHRKIWVVLCEAGNQQINMIFEDKSARLICMTMESDSNKRSAHELTSPVTTENEAVYIAVDRLKRLELLPYGSRIALRERPEQIYNKSMWEVNWLVRMPDSLVPSPIKLTINRTTGRPAFMVDLSNRF